MKRIDINGRRFGRLTVLGPHPVRTTSGEQSWSCRCDCGREVVVRGSNLRSGSTKSCGCSRSELIGIRSTKHGRSGMREYWIWRWMVANCHDPSSADYASYGGRGISVCDRWRDSFQSFLEDVGPRPTPAHVLGRIRDDLGYSPDNCRWTSRALSGRNRSNKILLTAFGETKCLLEWCEDPRCAAGYGTIIQRIRVLGWDHERAITTRSQRAQVKRSRKSGRNRSRTRCPPG